MLYRIVLAKYGGKLTASGRAARWNRNDVEMIYTASSRSLAYLENIVHRSQAGLDQLFNILTIDCPDNISKERIDLAGLAPDWADFGRMRETQIMGERWIKQNSSAILQVPSSIVNEEVNYLLNPHHHDFNHIKLIKVQPFVFDKRIKQ